MSRHLTTIFLYFGSLKSVFSPYFVKFQVQIVLINLFLDLGHMYFGHISVLKKLFFTKTKRVWEELTAVFFIRKITAIFYVIANSICTDTFIFRCTFLEWRIAPSCNVNGTFKILEHCTYNLTWAGPGWSRWCKVFLCQQNNLIFSFKFSLSQRGI